MVNRIMNNDLAEIGEEIIYNGETKHARDDITVELMKERLIIGNTYLVDNIRRSGPYNGYYVIKHVFYPPKSFYKKYNKK